MVPVAHQAPFQGPGGLVRGPGPELVGEGDGFGGAAAVDEPGLGHRHQRQNRHQRQRGVLEVECRTLLVSAQVDGEIVRIAGVAVGGAAVEQHVVAVRPVGGVVFGERDE